MAKYFYYSEYIANLTTPEKTICKVVVFFCYIFCRTPLRILRVLMLVLAKATTFCAFFLKGQRCSNTFFGSTAYSPVASLPTQLNLTHLALNKCTFLFNRRIHRHRLTTGEFTHQTLISKGRDRQRKVFSQTCYNTYPICALSESEIERAQCGI